MNNDIFAVLLADHKKHRTLLESIEKNINSDEGKKCFEEFTLEAKSHAAAEEQAFYSILMAKPELTDISRHSVSEHKEIEDLIEEMSPMNFLSREWTEKFHDLKKRYLHHIDEEEDEVFPAALKELDSAQQEKMGKKFNIRKPEEKTDLSD